MRNLRSNICLTEKDGVVLGIIAFFMVLLGFSGGLAGSSRYFQLAVVVLTVIAMFLGIYFTIKTKKEWGGELGRFLDVQSASMVLLTYMWVLTIVSHMELYLLSIPPRFWTSYLYAAGATGFFTAVYSFYLLKNLES